MSDLKTSVANAGTKYDVQTTEAAKQKRLAVHTESKPSAAAMSASQSLSQLNATKQEQPTTAFRSKEELFASLLLSANNEEDHDFGFLKKARNWDDAWPILDMAV